MDVEITNMPNLRVAAMRHTGPYNQIPVAFERLGAIAGPAGLFRQPGAEGIAIYYDDPESTAQDRLRSDAGVVVPDGVALPPGLTLRAHAARRSVRTTWRRVGALHGRVAAKQRPSSRAGHELRDLPERRAHHAEGAAHHGHVHLDRVSTRERGGSKPEPPYWCADLGVGGSGT
jgi:GyrI-like small molecule binding domain